MKKALFLVLICVVCKSATQAQSTIEIIPTVGYTFSDQVNFANTFGRIESAVNYGGSLIFNASRNFGIEMMYNRLEPHTGIYNYQENGNNQVNPPISEQKAVINYVMAGPVVSVGFGETPLHLFFGGLMGAAVFSPKPADYTSTAKFAWGLEAGTSVYVGSHFGIRLKAQLLSPVDNGGYYFGNWGYGAGAGYYGSSSIYQFGFNAGLIIGLGRKMPLHKPAPPPVHYQQQQPAVRYYYRTPPPPPPPPPVYYYHY